MAKIIKIMLRQQTHTGVACVSSRDIVVWGTAAEGDCLEKLAEALSDKKQLLAERSLIMSSTDVVRDTCDAIFPNSWDFAAQGGALEY